MIGFTLDGVTDFQSLTEADDIRDKFEVHHDPIYHMFEGEGHVVEFEYGQRKYLEIAVGFISILCSIIIAKRGGNGMQDCEYTIDLEDLF